jgi:hypothetical protein
VAAEPRRAAAAALAGIDVEELARDGDHVAIERGSGTATCRRGARAAGARRTPRRRTCPRAAGRR